MRWTLSSAWAISEGVQVNSAKTTVEAAVKVKPKELEVIDKMAILQLTSF